jgi:hypothetical protein
MVTDTSASKALASKERQDKYESFSPGTLEPGGLSLMENPINDCPASSQAPGAAFDLALASIKTQLRLRLRFRCEI